MNIKGQLTDIIFYNEENGYIVGILETEEHEVSIVGHMHSNQTGGTFTFTGEWTLHPTYGEQFTFTEYQEEFPESESAIKKYLSSGILKGIGPKTAESIVQKFGKDTFDIISLHPEKLTLISGIGPSKARLIAESFNSHRAIMKITMFLQKHNISPGYAIKLYKLYGEDTIDTILKNPYCLVHDVFGIGFRTADQIANEVGFSKSSTERITAGILYVLNYFTSEGHTFMPLDSFAEKAANILDLSKEQVQDRMTELALDGELHLENLENRTVVFPMPYFYAETNVCKNLIRLLNSDLKPIHADTGELIKLTENELEIKLAENQKQAVSEALSNGIYILTGGPGTGKTTTINSLIHIFKKCGLSTGLAAPTGRAAKRITETSGYEAKTLHRLLEYSFFESESSMRFGKNEENPLEYDVIIIDEVSMVDILLMNSLLKAITTGTRLILVGDADQLPSVGAGNVLRDILNSEIIPSVKLDKIFRQAQESLIIVNAHKINHGEYPDYNEKDKDFFFLKQNNENKILNTIKSLSFQRLPDYFENCHPVKDIQVLTPARKGMLGTYNLNRELQQLLNPSDPAKQEKALKDKLFRVGDKVMQIKNNYDIQWKKESDFSDGQGIFNGDVGFIESIDNEYGEMLIRFDEDKLVTYDFSQIDELELAYAVTVHKSQGSEFPIVIMPICWFPPILATRNLLYTGITRARQAVVLAGSEKYLHGMIDNNRIVERYSGLNARLQKLLSEKIIDF